MTISFSGLDEALDALSLESSGLQGKSHELLEELSDIGMDWMKLFETPVGSYEENNAYADKIVTDNKASIAAIGDKVYMIEYGSGDQTEKPFSPGSYSRTEGTGEYARTGKWHHGGTEFTGQPAERYAYKAYDSILNNIPTTAKEVFGK